MMSRKYALFSGTILLVGLICFFSPAMRGEVRGEIFQVAEGRRRPYSSPSAGADEALIEDDAAGREDKDEGRENESGSKDYGGKSSRESGFKTGRGSEVEIVLEGVLAWDYSYYSQARLDGARGEWKRQWLGESELRRASLDLKSKLNKDLQAELELSFASGEKSSAEVEDAYMEFGGLNNAALTIGQAKEPFGLEELTSSEDLITIERSMATSAFVPGRRPGLKLSGVESRFTWAFGVYEALDRKEKKDTYAATGRLTLLPWRNKSGLLHLGLSGSVRDFGGEEYRIKERAEVHTAPEIVNSVKTLADKVNLAGFEAALCFGPILLQAEYMAASIKAEVGDEAGYEGYYLQASYSLSGESREYKKGVFNSLQPRAQGAALELLARSSVLDASLPLSGKRSPLASSQQSNHQSRAGVKAANLTLGLNYYLSRRVRLMLNYIQTNLTGSVAKEANHAKAISFRAQYGL